MLRVLALAAVSGCASHPGSESGVIALSNSAAALPSNEAHGSARADFASGASAALVCRTSATFGGCRVRTKCVTDDTALTHYSAGLLTIEGTTTAPLTLSPGDSGLYSGAGVADGRISAPSTQLEVHAAGDQVPHFDLSLTSPEPLTVLAPSRATTDVARTTDLGVAWTGLTVGTVAVSIDDGLDEPSSIACSFPGAEGAGAIPASALAYFASPSGRLAISANTSVSTTFDAWDVMFRVTDDAAWADGGSGVLNLAFHD
jgi:hypothetical protein